MMCLYDSSHTLRYTERALIAVMRGVDEWVIEVKNCIINWIETLEWLRNQRIEKLDNVAICGNGVCLVRPIPADWLEKLISLDSKGVTNRSNRFTVEPVLCKSVSHGIKRFAIIPRCVETISRRRVDETSNGVTQSAAEKKLVKCEPSGV